MKSVVSEKLFEQGDHGGSHNLAVGVAHATLVIPIANAKVAVLETAGMKYALRQRLSTNRASEKSVSGQVNGC
jgi:hypothetical protein